MRGGSWGLNSGPQAQCQASLPTEPPPRHDFHIPFPVEFHSGSGGCLAVCPITLCHWLAQCGLSPSSEEQKGQTCCLTGIRARSLGEGQQLDQSILGEGQQLDLRESENSWFQWVVPGPMPSSCVCPGDTVMGWGLLVSGIDPFDVPVCCHLHVLFPAPSLWPRATHSKSG